MSVSKGKNRTVQLTRAEALKCTPIKTTEIKEERLETEIPDLSESLTEGGRLGPTLWGGGQQGPVKKTSSR